MLRLRGIRDERSLQIGDARWNACCGADGEVTLHFSLAAASVVMSLTVDLHQTFGSTARGQLLPRNWLFARNRSSDSDVGKLLARLGYG